MFIRDSWDGGDTWNEFRSIGRYTTTGFDLVSHNGDLCIAHKGSNNNHIYVGCATDGWWDWSSTTWYDTGSFRTNKQPALASTFGTLWLGHTGTDNVVYLASSYDNGQTWNPSFSINNRSSSSGVSMVGIGDQNWENERLCVLRRGTNDEMYQSCLYRYGPNYDQWNWHPWQLQQGQTNDTPVLVSDSSRIGQIHRTMVNNVESRTVEWVNPGGRGYISHMRWDEDPGFNQYARPAYEHEVYLYNDSNSPYNNQTYITKDNEDPSSCFPKVRYSASNLPHSYVDTRRNQERWGWTWCDSNGTEVSYTIGSTDPESIETSKYYFTYWNSYEGDLYVPVFKIQGQLGKKYSSGCHGDTWCVTDKYYTRKITPPLSGDWHNQFSTNPNPNRGNNYPYWYEELNL